VAVARIPGGERILAFLGPGAIVGEMSIIDGDAVSISGRGASSCIKVS